MVDEADKIQAIFLAALEQPESQRAAFLDQRCGAGTPRRQRVEELLAAHVGSDSLLDLTSPLLPRAELPWLLQPGSMIGPYKLLEEIGHGGMGVVYLAEQSTPVQRRVALKVIKPGMDSRSVVSRFEAERQVLSLMDHPHIAKVFDGGTTDSGLPYFVMELVKGRPITQYCDERRLSLRERIALFIPVCQAIQHAHQKGIIHRDIKPTNVLVAEGDDRPLPKVIDFGVAKALDQPLSENTLFTGMGQIVGTLEYLSPEQAEGNRADIDTRSDVYSLGVLLYELLAGTTPFEPRRLRAAAFDEMLRIVREEEPPRPSTRLSSHDNLPLAASNRQSEPARLSGLLRGELDWVVMKSLEKDRNRRYESPTALADDLQRYLADEAVQACSPSRRYRVGKFLRRYRGPVVAASLITMTLLAATLVSSLLAVRAITAEQAADRELGRAIWAEKTAEKEAAHAREEAAKAQSENATVAALSEFLIKDLLSQASPYEQPDPDIKLRTVVDRAAERIGTRFKDQPRVEASIRDVLSQIYDSIGKTEESDRHLERAYELSYQELGTEDPQTLRLASRRASAEDSLASLQEILAMQQRKLGNYHQDTVRTVRYIALAFEIRNQPLDAITVMKPVVEHYETKDVGLQPDAPGALNSYANLLRRVGRGEEALIVYQKALQAVDRMKGKEDPTALLLRHNVGTTLSRRGDVKEALEVFVPTFDTRHRVLGKHHLALMHTFVEMRYAIQRCKTADAKFSIDAAAALIGALQQKNAPSAGFCTALGLAYQEAGNGELALQHLEKSVELSQGGGVLDWFLLSLVYAQLGQLDVARRWYDQAAAVLVRDGSLRRPLRPFTMDIARTLGIRYDAKPEIREAWRQEMRDRAKAARFVPDNGQAAEWIPRDLHAYRDPDTGMQESVLWGWGRKGRPLALFVAKFQGWMEGDILSEGELVSLCDRPFVARGASGWRWAPDQAGMVFKSFPESIPAPGNEQARSLQLLELASQFTARLSGSVQLGRLPEPVHRYADPETGLLDGAIFLFSHKENPEIALLVEARQEKDGAARWEYGFARLSAGPLSAVLNEEEVWSVPAWNGTSAEYLLTIEPYQPED